VRREPLARACAEIARRAPPVQDLPPEHGRTEDQHHNEAQ
jgi:hypothetical protein